MKSGRILKFPAILAFAVLFFCGPVLAQDTGGYKFTDIKRLPDTPVKNQYRSGTCWSYSGLSFLESELLRMGKPEVDLAPMWIVRNAYDAKATKYVRMDGNISFGSGGEFNDVANVFKNDGIVPMSVYEGLDYGTDKPVLGELDEVLKDYVDGIVKNKNHQITTAWHKGFDGILDAYFGKRPVSFQYDGKTYTPESFAASLGLNMDNYVLVSSFTHHPFYQPFQIEVPDNWSWGSVYNVPLDDMMKIVDNSLDKGYTVAWAADVSEKGFQWDKGYAIVPEQFVSEASGAYSTDTVQAQIPEKTITQEMRQEAFDNQTTTDDHGMQIIGLAKDQSGNRFYIVKNSWGTTRSPYKGYFYASVPYVRYKTTSIMVNKDAIPNDIRKKLGL